MQLNVLGTQRPRPTSFQERLHAIRAQLLPMSAGDVTQFFALTRFDKLLKTTITLCPTCLAHIPAAVYELDGRVLMSKRCPEHGISLALLECDAAFYHLSNKDQWGQRFADDRVMDFPAFDSGGCCEGDDCCTSGSSDAEAGFDFTDQRSNKTCTVLVEVTNACNLACAVCYSDAKGDRKMPLELFQRYMTDLVAQKRGLDSVQLTGGEATLHPQFWDMVAFLHQLKAVKRIYLPTNGIVLARQANAERLAPFKDKMMVLLQFDGRTVDTSQPLRNANTIALRQRVIHNLAELGIYMQLTMTVARGVNDQDVGWVVDTALRHRVVKVAALQPVTYSGRYDLACDPLNRLTLSDVIKGVVAQAQKRMASRDFLPIPCSHPNCGWVTLFARRFGLTLNIARRIDLARAMDRVAYKTVLTTGEIRGALHDGSSLGRRAAAMLARRFVRARDVVGIAVKPFMDRFNYDQDRISACCHHTLDTQGRPVSFCEYNARLRETDPMSMYPKLSE